MLLRTLLLGLCLSVAAADPAPPLTVADLFKIKRIRQVAISPDGARVAYVLSRSRTPLSDEDGPAFQELRVIEIASRRDRRYVAKGGFGGLSWRPGGAELCFMDKRDEHPHRALYAIAHDGGGPRLIASLKGRGIGGFAWSPDGSQLALVSAQPESAEQKKTREAGFKAEIYEEDGRPSELFLRRGDSEPKRLPIKGTVSGVVFSPDGSRLAVTVAQKPLVDHHLMYRRVQIVDTAGNQLTAIENPGKLRQVVWSPSGRQLALVCAADLRDMTNGTIAVVPATGGTPRNLSHEQKWHAQQVRWVGETTLLAHVDHGVGTRMVRVGVAGPTFDEVGVAKGHVLGNWSSSADGKVWAFVASAPDRPDELVAGKSLATLSRLTAHHDWIRGKRLGKQEVVEYAARDGLKIQGLLIRPLNEKPGRRHPLVLIVHGGPESHYRNGWMSWYGAPGQVFAARGCAVFYPNYRGSTGRGVAFSRTSYGDPAGKEFDDLVDAVEHLVKSGLVDRSKVGVTGGSYGGYASAWCATKLSRHFAAAVMNVGLSDLIHFAGTTDIPDEMRLVHFRTHIWERWDFFEQRSPLRHVDKARTPILIMHGKDDTRVPPSQSRAFYRYLKLKGTVPVRLVLYPGEGHGNRKAAAQLDYCLRLLRWMKHYLQGPRGAAPPHALKYADALK